MSGPLLTVRRPVASMRPSVTGPALLILGTDAVLAATPATPVQLVHACLAIGYQSAVPASWGDELIAARVLDRLRQAEAPVLQCSCPIVARRLSAHGALLAPSLLAIAPPPVATARYLRAICTPLRPHITYAGSCPSADHESIDVWLTPDALASAFAERGVSPLEQPTEFDSILPPDRRRFFSDPGGVPSLPALRELPVDVTLAEPGPADLTAEIAQLLLSGSRTLIDAAPSLGCSCCGASRGVGAAAARAAVRASEPPRALGPVVDHDLPLLLEPVAATPALVASEAPIVLAVNAGTDAPAVLSKATHVAVNKAQSPPPVRIAPESPVEAPRISSAVAVAGEQVPAARAIVETPGRPSPGSVRAVHGAIPQTRTDAGRQLPRAYIARRRSTPGGVRSSTALGSRRSPGSTRNALARWVIAAAAILGGGVLLVWLAQSVR